MTAEEKTLEVIHALDGITPALIAEARKLAYSYEWMSYVVGVSPRDGRELVAIERKFVALDAGEFFETLYEEESERVDKDLRADKDFIERQKQAKARCEAAKP